MRNRSLREHLLLLVAAAIVPLAMASGFALLALVNQQGESGKRSGVEITRALATAVDAELHRSISALETLATAMILDAGNLRSHHELLRRVVATRPEWLSVVLHDSDANMLLNTRLEFGAKMPATAESQSLHQAIQTRRPAVGYLARGALDTYNLPVRVPVMRDGRLLYVLTAVIKPDSIAQIVARQRLPADWVVSVFDAKAVRVARSRQHEQFLGKGPAPSLKSLMDGDAVEGSGMSYALEGDRVYTAYTRSQSSGWTVAIGIPPSVVEFGALRSLITYGGGVLFSIIIGILAALFIVRRITVPMAALSAAAQALGRRESFRKPESEILEIRRVAESLDVAARERAMVEAEREQLLRREQDARSAAESASRAKDEFLAMLGHEMRNPLGAIANASHLLQHPALDSAGAQRAREVIDRQVDHLSRLTDDLLDAGRAVMGKIVLQRQPLDLAAVAARALDTLQSTGRLSNHRLECSLEAVWVNADYTRIEQIVVNLVGNAVKFTPPGGTITVTVGTRGRDAMLSVRDTGVGMSADLRAHVFELFFQGERAIDRPQGGLGIGLTLVRRLAELHEGFATAASDGPGQGSEISVYLPAIPPPLVLEADARETACAPQCDILIVDDNHDGAHTLRRLLELAGHTVRFEKDGNAGLHATLSNPPDVALIDIGLPGMDGYELAGRIRAALGERAPLLVAITGYGLPEDRARALAAGFDVHLVKPVDLPALDAMLGKVRSRYRTSGQNQ